MGARVQRSAAWLRAALAGTPGRFWRSPADQPPWARPALLAIAAVAGLTYAWGMDGAALEAFYGAAARSMSMSWHNFFFGAFDPAGTVSVDKLPGAPLGGAAGRPRGGCRGRDQPGDRRAEPGQRRGLAADPADRAGSGCDLEGSEQRAASLAVAGGRMGGARIPGEDDRRLAGSAGAGRGLSARGARGSAWAT